MQYQHAGPVTNYSSGGMVAPVTGTQNAAVLRAEVKQGVREVIACKGPDGKVGLRVRAINKGVFISFVQAGSAASLAGLRFGDQILQINGETLAGYDNDKVMKILKKASAQEIRFAVRDRLAKLYSFEESLLYLGHLHILNPKLNFLQITKAYCSYCLVL